MLKLANFATDYSTHSMIERIIIIDKVDPVIFYGLNNANIQLIRNLFPKLRLAARGSVIKVIGDDNETALFEEKINQLADYCAKYNQLPQEVIIDTIKGDPPKELNMGAAAVDALLEDQRNVMIGIANDDIVYVPFSKAIKNDKPINRELLSTLRRLSI